jgi:acyl-CoA thioesterase
VKAVLRGGFFVVLMDFRKSNPSRGVVQRLHGKWPKNARFHAVALALYSSTEYIVREPYLHHHHGGIP